MREIERQARAIRELFRSAIISRFLSQADESEAISLLAALEVNLAGLAESERKALLMPSDVSSLAQRDQHLQGLTVCVLRAEQLWQRLQEQIPPTRLTDALAVEAPKETPALARARELTGKPELSPVEFYEMASAIGEVRREITENETIEAVKAGLIGMEPNLFDELRGREQKFQAFLGSDRTHDEEGFFLVLKRWNSYSPILSSPDNPSMGGGYFLSWHGKGIVIDPGISYIRNMIECGLRFADIDAVFVTHAHIDHCADFEPFLTLLYEYNKKSRRTKKKCLDIFMNLGSLRKFSGWVPLRSRELRLHTLEPESIRRLETTYGLSVQIIPAKHDEILATEYAVGLIFSLGKDCRIGITGDTGWDPALGEYYLGCRLLVPHIGSIKVEEFSTPGYIYPNHLGIRGLTALVETVAPEIVLISEFGEEFSGALRVQVARAIVSVMRQRVGREMSCLPADVGLKLRLTDLQVQVLDDVGKERWVPASDVRTQVASGDRDRIEYRV